MQWQKKAFTNPAEAIGFAGASVSAAAQMPDYPSAAILVANGNGVTAYLGRPGATPTEEAGLMPGWELCSPPAFD
jgi:hypothetical protein